MEAAIDREGPRGLWAVSAVAGILVLLYGAIAPHVMERRCLMQEETGLPCPLCGATRAIASLVSGDILAALALHPVVIAGALVGVVAGTAALLMPERRAAISKGLWVFGGILGWVWLAWYGARISAELICWGV